MEMAQGPVVAGIPAEAVGRVVEEADGPAVAGSQVVADFQAEEAQAEAGKS